jgi:hypothetical protein
VPRSGSTDTLRDGDARSPASALTAARSTSHAAYAATADSRLAFHRWPHLAHRQSAPASIALCVSDVAVWHIGHVLNGEVSRSLSGTVAVTVGGKESRVMGRSQQCMILDLALTAPSHRLYRIELLRAVLDRTAPTCGGPYLVRSPGCVPKAGMCRSVACLCTREQRRSASVRRLSTCAMR